MGIIFEIVIYLIVEITIMVIAELITSKIKKDSSVPARTTNLKININISFTYTSYTNNKSDSTE